MSSNLIIPTVVGYSPVQNTTPTFQDNFSTGVLNTSFWATSSGATPGEGNFVAGNVQLTSFGGGANCCTLKITSNSSTSNSGQIQSVANTYFHGTYQWVFRAGSDAANLTAPGFAYSGQVSSPFMYDNEGGSGPLSEIDAVEIEGQFPNYLESGCWSNASSHSVSFLGAYQPHAALHTYTIVFSASKIEYYYDGLLWKTLTSNLPTHGMAIFCGFYATNAAGFGGVRTNLARQAYLTQFTYWSG